MNLNRLFEALLGENPSQAQGGPSEEMRIEAYKQACEDFRQLNQMFWQAPTIIVTITGGLGLAVATQKLNPEVQFWLLIFAGICNLVWILVLCRLRLGVMAHLLKRTRRMSNGVVARNPHRLLEHSVLFLFCLLLAAAAAGCFSAAFNRERLFGAAVVDLRTVTVPTDRYILVPIPPPKK